MRVLLLHCDYLEFEAKKKAVKEPEEVREPTGRLDECVVCFMSVEKPDEDSPEYVVEEALKVIDSMMSQVKAENLVLYPYAHLSSNLGSLDFARKTLDELNDKASQKYKTLKAPFGWYKSFGLKCKGHPLSELSRTISPAGAQKKEDEESEALKKEDKIQSHWHILTEDGKLHEVGEFDYSGRENLKKFAYYERAKSRALDAMPPHIELMRRLELVDYEPASDGGNMRYYPKGRMIKALLEAYVTEKILDYGGLEVETPLMYDMVHPTLEKYLNRFPARQYTVLSEDKKYFLRFAACFGQFLMAHDATLSYRNLPLKLYELARYAFRREKSGELAGLRRLRAFTMPDVHALCAGMEQSMQEYKRRLNLCVETIEGIGLTKDDVELGLRVTREFYESNREFIEYLVKEFGKPALVEMWDERIFYFMLKYEFNFIDSMDKASALSTDQIDVENGCTYDIQYTDSDGQRKNPIILHCSPSGAIERIIYALLEKAYMAQKNSKTPKLPIWLSPTQIRIIPLSDRFLDKALELCDRLSAKKIRVDVDDRSESMGKKIRDAEREWIPYIMVLGEKEIESGKVSVRVRGEKDQKTLVAEAVAVEILQKTNMKPYRKIPLPKLLSERPIFVG
jgi:threonyl-tRNA synthetase